MDDQPPVGGRDRRLDLSTDCSRCAGLCCVALKLTRSGDFPLDKPPGVPCVNLELAPGPVGHSCRIHAGLLDQGYAGCVTFDCLGAGQRITMQRFAGQDWRTDRAVAERMFGELLPLRELHVHLWCLTEAIDRLAEGPLLSELVAALKETEALCQPGSELSWGDIDRQGHVVLELLRAASALIRAAGLAGASSPREPLSGKRLRWADLRGMSLAGADLRQADLRGADLLDADLRGADLCGADLSEALFLTQGQLNSARGDGATVLPPVLLRRPGHWNT